MEASSTIFWVFGNNNKRTKKENPPNSGLYLSGWPQSKIFKSKKRDKNLDLVKELKKIRNMKMTMISIVICVLRTIPKGLVKWLED